MLWGYNSVSIYFTGSWIRPYEMVSQGFFDERKNKFTVRQVEDVSGRDNTLGLVRGYCLLYGFRKRLAGGYYLSE